MKSFKNTVSVLACLAFAGAAAASDLLVGGSTGIMQRGHPVQGNFQFYGTCGGPIDSMTMLGTKLYLGTDFGVVYVYDTLADQVTNSFNVGNDITGLAVHNGQLLVSNSAGIIRRVNPVTGAVLATYNANMQVEAMVQLDGYLYVGGAAGSVHRADADVGTFSYFTCFCNGPINAMAIIGERLYVMDTFNNVLNFRLSDGMWDGQFFSLPAAATAMVAEGSQLLIASANGTIRRVNPASGQVLATMGATVNVQSMLLRNNDACPGDFDNDGFISGADFDLYVQAFEAGDLDADHDGDGFVNGNDFDQYVLTFEQGC